VAVSRPKVITRQREDGVIEEPWEMVTLDVETRHQGATMEQLGERGGELLDMLPDGAGGCGSITACRAAGSSGSSRTSAA
jgi:GTP-binding protein